jgi:hypothetical protein
MNLFEKPVIFCVVGITWEDAPLVQYASHGLTYKIMCRVRAQPPANIDWLKKSHIIASGKWTARSVLSLQLFQQIKTYCTVYTYVCGGDLKLKGQCPKNFSFRFFS